MGYADELITLAVRIGGKDGGSGVLIKPLDTSLLYILTANHCLKDVNEDTVELSFADSLYEGVEIGVKKIYRDDNTDAAIIVVNRFDDGVRFTGFANKPFEPHINGYHTGFPSCRENENKIREFAIRDVNRLWQDKGDLVEYTYTPVPQKHELTGLSGGGVYNEKFQLLGIHKQSAYQDNIEQLGAALYIPCRCFYTLMVANGLSPVYEFDLSSFRPFKDDIFKLDNMGAMVDLECLLGSIATLGPGLLDKSPKDLFEAFQQQRRCREIVRPYCLKREDWTMFGEFLIAVKILKRDDIHDFEVEQIGRYFQYIYSEEDFDMFEVRKKLNVNLMGMLHDKDCVYVVGGLSSKGVNYDVKIRNKVPELNVATYSEGFDIADAGNSFMCNLTFVNVNLFRDLMEFYAPELNDLNGREMEMYQSLLNKRIYG